MQVYTQTLRAAGVPESTLATYEPYLGNMVGLVRGNLYYNLINWYRCLSCLPVGDTSKYMETMMGVKQVWKTRFRFSLVEECIAVFLCVSAGMVFSRDFSTCLRVIPHQLCVFVYVSESGSGTGG